MYNQIPNGCQNYTQRIFIAHIYVRTYIKRRRKMKRKLKWFVNLYNLIGKDGFCHMSNTVKDFSSIYSSNTFARPSHKQFHLRAEMLYNTHTKPFNYVFYILLNHLNTKWHLTQNWCFIWKHVKFRSDLFNTHRNTMYTKCRPINDKRVTLGHT